MDLIVEVGETFILDGSESQDDIGIQSYKWQMEAESRTGDEAEFMLNEAGIYFATLTVTDEAGNSDKVTTKHSHKDSITITLD